MEKNDEFKEKPFVSSYACARFKICNIFIKNKFGVNIGCQKIRYPNKINLDVTYDKSDPDILADVRYLPFRNSVFEEVIFSDVLEHTPKGTEVQSLKEIERVLKKEGTLIMSVPNNTMISKILDLLFWLQRHRRYNKSDMVRLFKERTMNIQHIFSSGKIPFGVITLPYVINWILRRYATNYWILRRKERDLFHSFIDNSHAGTIGNCGGTLFIIAKKR